MRLVLRIPSLFQAAACTSTITKFRRMSVVWGDSGVSGTSVAFGFGIGARPIV